jgi:hypothetical protein
MPQVKHLGKGKGLQVQNIILKDIKPDAIKQELEEVRELVKNQ